MESNKILLKKTLYHYLEYKNPGKPKLLMLHGLMVESHCFEKMAEILKNNFQLYLLDLKGHGETEKGSSYIESYTPEIISGEIYEFYQKVLLEPFYLLGYSLGGQFALKYNSLYPETIKKLILIDSSPSVSMKAFFKIIQLILNTPTDFKDKEHVLNFYNLKLKGLGDYMLKYCVSESKNGRYHLKYDKKHISPSTFIGYKRRSDSLWAATKIIKNPVLIIKGENSSIMDHSIMEKMKNNIEKSEFVILKNVAHDLAFSEPEKVSELINSFIAK